MNRSLRSDAGSPEARKATVPAITPISAGIGPKVQELEMVIDYQLKACAAEADSIVKVEGKKDDTETKLGGLKEACAEHLASKREEMRKRAAQQKQETGRIQKQISRLKDEHCQHQQALLGLQRRISDIDLFIGD